MSGAVHRIEKMLHGAGAVVRMQALDPIFMPVVLVGRQTVDFAIFRRPLLVSKAITEINGEGSHLGHLPDACESACAVLWRLL